MNWSKLDLSVTGLRKHYLHGDFTPADLIEYLFTRIDAMRAYNAWIEVLSRDAVSVYVEKLQDQKPEALPLYGVPFAIKDNIDLAGVPTTAACPEFTYVPENHAEVVKNLIDAGAIPLGKTNMDQFATGLNGTRSPYGICHNAANPEYISGGSSSGSAVALALQQVAFSLGTDTAGSGRVPAALNNIFGLKPTRGSISTRGVVPACKSLDCVNLFCVSLEDVEYLLPLVYRYDNQDCYARANTLKTVDLSMDFSDRIKVGVPEKDHLEFFSDHQCATAFSDFVKKLQDMNAEVVELDYVPFRQAADLLYNGPWLAERVLSLREALLNYPQAIHPAVYESVKQGDSFSALDVFEGAYQLAELKRLADTQLAKADIFVTPTCPLQPTINEVLDDPLVLNTRMGYYTNYMNLLDCCALAIPAGHTARGIPFGVTLIAKAFEDRKLLAFGRLFR